MHQYIISSALLLAFSIAIAGCGNKGSLENLKADDAAMLSLAIASSGLPQKQEMIPFEIVAAEDEGESWRVTIQKKGASQINSIVRVDKANKKVEAVNN